MSSNFKIFFNHGEEDHPKSVKLKCSGGTHVIKFQNFLQPWWRRSSKKCEIKVFWWHSGHQGSNFSSTTENRLKKCTSNIAWKLRKSLDFGLDLSLFVLFFLFSKWVATLKGCNINPTWLAKRSMMMTLICLKGWIVVGGGYTLN